MKKTRTIARDIKMMVVGALLMALMIPAVGVFAANDEPISAVLARGISVRFNGQNQVLRNADGHQVFPILYEGTTYLPLRAIAGLLGIDVEWESATRTVVLGGDATREATEFRLQDVFTQLNRTARWSIVADPNIVPDGYSVAWRAWSGVPDPKHISLDGNFTELTFTAWIPEYRANSGNLTIRSGDSNGPVLRSVDLEDMRGQKFEVTVDITGIRELTLSTRVGVPLEVSREDDSRRFVYMLDPIVR